MNLYKYLQYKLLIIFKYMIFIFGLFILLFLISIKDSFAYTATAPSNVCSNCTETVNNTTPGVNLTGIRSDNSSAGYQISAKSINSSLVSVPIVNTGYNITGSSFSGTSNGTSWGPAYNYWIDSTYYNSCHTTYLWNIGYTTSSSSPFCNAYDTPPSQQYPSNIIVNNYTNSGSLDSNGNSYVSPSVSNLDCTFNDFTITLTIPKSSYNLTGYSPVAYEYYPGSSSNVILYGQTYRTGVLLLGANITYSSGNFIVTVTGVLLQNMQSQKISIYLAKPASQHKSKTSGCSLTLNANPLNPQYPSDTVLSGTVTYSNGSSVPADSNISISQNPSNASTISSPITTNGSGGYSATATLTSQNQSSVTYTASFNNSGIVCSSSPVTVTWGSSNCANSISAAGCELPVQPQCNRNAYKELYINGSLVGFGGIYNYRDMGGCNPSYPSLRVSYNLKYISLYNINFIKLIGHNLQYWMEEGI